MLRDGVCSACRADLIVAERLVIEVTSVERVSEVRLKRMEPYLRLLKLPVGLLDQFWRRNIEGRIQAVR